MGSCHASVRRLLEGQLVRRFSHAPLFYHQDSWMIKLGCYLFSYSHSCVLYPSPLCAASPVLIHLGTCKSTIAVGGDMLQKWLRTRASNWGLLGSGDCTRPPEVPSNITFPRILWKCRKLFRRISSGQDSTLNLLQFVTHNWMGDTTIRAVTTLPFFF